MQRRQDSTSPILPRLSAGVKAFPYQAGYKTGPEVLDQRRAELHALEAEQAAQRNVIAAARRSIDKCSMRASFDAVVLERLGQVGELANPGTPLLRVLDRASIELSA